MGHKGKFGHEFLEFEFKPNGRLRYANNSQYKADTLIRKEVYVNDIILDELYLKEVVYKIYKTVCNYGSYIDSADIRDHILYNKKIDIAKAFKQLKYLKFKNCIQFTKKIDNINKDRCIALNELYELLFTLDIINEYDNIKVLYDKGYRKFKINNIIIEILINDCLDCKM